MVLGTLQRRDKKNQLFAKPENFFLSRAAQIARGVPGLLYNTLRVPAPLYRGTPGETSGHWLVSAR